MTTKEIIKITVNLLVIYVAGGVLLASIYAYTSPIIFKESEKEKKEALQKMIPEADKIEKLGDWHPHEKHAEYFAAKKDGQVLGYIVQVFGKGYSSYINILFAVNKELIVQKVDILSQAETPGLGDEITAPSFTGQFVGKDTEHLKVKKEETKEYVQSITGATISSRAVTEDGIKNGIIFLDKALKGGSSPSNNGEKQEGEKPHGSR
ncbi:FMN-binding protein [Candidatus Magnetominusculus xianensis]|uniref:Ion-translocating oxidoreductase complex subunit G n=1 Tax=Candidatus Magnetominusculus xianensis TaxID=1748249 RepID=A0ABR5SJH0_9BACT|nr:FMN-binding protein [Candidatus Magnetominusculus xianensis]KWT94613.1 RnfABCDGE type electron transport complex subunit G [Candidatus Magnetominusculus xianensis]MBF0403325.1 FMN-binding protein [Nitrospirota bacterium]